MALKRADCFISNIEVQVLTAESVKGTTLAFQSVNNVNSSNGLTFGMFSRPVRSIQFLILHIKYNTYLYFSIICVNNFYKKIVTFGHEAFKV